MSGKTITRSPIVMVCAALMLPILFVALACSSSTATPAAQLPAEEQPVAAESLPTSAPQQPAQDVEAPEQPALAQSIIGFWKAKIVGKEVIVFEFQEGGGTIWHYTYASGEKKNLTGTYRFSDNMLVVDVGGEQQLSAQLDGNTLTLTVEDKPLVMQRVTSVDGPSPTASTNIAQDIIARWQDQAAQEWIEFKSDSTLAITSSSNNLSGTYSISGNALSMKLNDQGESSSFTVEIDGNVLTLYAADGTYTDYVK